jgi:hypothetical protein
MTVFVGSHRSFIIGGSVDRTILGLLFYSSFSLKQIVIPPLPSVTPRFSNLIYIFLHISLYPYKRETYFGALNLSTSIDLSLFRLIFHFFDLVPRSSVSSLHTSTDIVSVHTTFLQGFVIQEFATTFDLYVFSNISQISNPNETSKPQFKTRQNRNLLGSGIRQMLHIDLQSSSSILF